MTNTREVRRPVRLAGALAMVGLLAVSGCKSLDVENLNGVSVDNLQSNPAPAAVKSAAQGLMQTWRSVTREQANTLTKYGYEVWQIRSSSPPSLTGIVLFPNTGTFWSSANYGWIANINAFLKAVDAVADRNADPVSGYTDAQKAAMRGWAKTILAAAYEHMEQAHDTFGIVLDLPANPLNEVPPIATKAQVWARIFQLLDQADQHLADAGTTAFPFTLGPGYAGFNTPALFRKVNRALKARYQVLTGDYAGALTSLGASFIDPAATTRAGLLRGPFHTYTTQTNDQTNDLVGTDYYYNTRLRTAAQEKSPGVLDDRVAFKARTVTSFTFLGVTSNLKANDFYNATPGVNALTNITSLPIIRNEELILLRAEANLACTPPTGPTAGTDPVICTGGPAARAAALADINLIRVNSGGLPLIAVDPGQGGTGTGDLLLDELLYNKRYSLWGEFGTSWLDMRHYSRANQIPRYSASFLVFDVFPIPQSECEVRGYSTKGCFQGGYNGVPGSIL
jgi:hypothetical protein